MNYTPLSTRNRSISRIVTGIGLGGLLLAGASCDAGITLRPKAPTFVAQAQFGGAAGVSAQPTSPSYVSAAEPVAGYSAAPAPVASGSYQQIGGASAASATLAAIGTRIEGRVSKGAPRYFALNLSVGDSLALKMYVRKLDPDNNPTVSFRLLEPDNVALAKQSEYVSAPMTEYERAEMSATAGQAGRHILMVKANHPSEFRIDISAVNLAGN